MRIKSKFFFSLVLSLLLFTPVTHADDIFGPSNLAIDTFIDDDGSHFTEDNVEAALQELGAGTVPGETLGTVSDRGATTDQVLTTGGLNVNSNSGYVTLGDIAANYGAIGCLSTLTDTNYALTQDANNTYLNTPSVLKYNIANVTHMVLYDTGLTLGEGRAANLFSYLYGHITAAGTDKYIRYQVNDTTDYYELTREDANILGFDIQMPTSITDSTGLTIGEDIAGGTPNAEGILKLWSDGDNAFYSQVKTGTQTEIVELIMPLAKGTAGQVLEIASVAGNVITLEWDTDSTGAGGSAIIYDIGDDGGNDSVDVTEIATTGDTNSIFTEPAADKILINLANNWPGADTVTTNANLTGEVTSVGNAATIADSITVTGWTMGASVATTPGANDNDTSLATTAFCETTQDYLKTAEWVASSTTVAGKVELSTTAEINTGTDSTRAIPVDQFVASKRNIRWLVFNLVEAATDCAVATNIAGDFVSPIAGTVLQSDSTPFYLYATNSTAGTTGTMVVDISFGGTSIMTTNKLDFDTTEKTTTTAATPPDVTDTTLAVGDIITIDIDVIHTTAAAGLTVYMAIRE